jgi:hypothetical protein
MKQHYDHCGKVTMTDLIQQVNLLRDVPHSDLRPLIQRVCVILSSSRSGSSLLTSLLAQHPNIASLTGEIEPFLILTGNGFGYNSESDAIGALSNPSALADNIFDDLTVPSQDLPALSFLKKKWERRLLLQFPALFTDKTAHDRLIGSLDAVLTEANVEGVPSEGALQAAVLATVFSHDPWRKGYYDGNALAGAGSFYNEPLKIEEPPFVVPRHYSRPFSIHDIHNTTLLFKSPADAYRIGLYEQLFPNAQIQYIHLTRGYAQAINGLMDGWLSPRGFFAHDLSRLGISLGIKGYSDVVAFGKQWWKFDLPPNWKEFTDTSLEGVCLNQWLSSHRSILASGVQTLRVAFEDFLSDPASMTRRITNYLDVESMVLPELLPVTMSTEAPQNRRWKKRERQLLAIGQTWEVRAMMESLGYEMDPETWL